MPKNSYFARYQPPFCKNEITFAVLVTMKERLTNSNYVIMEKLNIVITDRHPVVRIGLERLVKGSLGSDTTITFCADFEEVHKIVRKGRKPIDLLIAGHAFNDVSEISQCVAVSAEKFGFGVPVLVFSELDEEIYAPLCLASGASGFVRKNAWFSVLTEAIDTVLKGGCFANGRSIRRAEERQALLGKRADPTVKLSKREREISSYLAKGHSCMDISDRLKLHRSTVSTYKSRVFKKLKVVTDAQFAKLWNSYSSGSLATPASGQNEPESGNDTVRVGSSDDERRQAKAC